MKTRIRIYSLKEKGLCFSYVTEAGVIVVGGRYDEKNLKGLHQEMESMELKYIDRLIIPNWDSYFCKPSELNELLINLQPDEIIYTEGSPKTESEKASLKYIKEYTSNDSSYSIEEHSKDEKDFFVRDMNDLVVAYINKGNLSVAFFSQCNSIEEYDFIVNNLSCVKIDIIVSGKSFINEGFSKMVIDKLAPHTAVGRINPNIKDNESRMLSVALHDIFISKVGDNIIRLKLGEMFPEVI